MSSPKKRKLLKDINLNEVSLVYRPMNQLARTVLCKSKDGLNPSTETASNEGGNHMKPEELAKALETSEAEVSTLTKRAEAAEKERDEAKAEVEALTKAAQDADLTISKSDDGEVTISKAAEPEYVEIDGEKVEKSAVPAPILKRLEAQEADIRKMKEEREAEVLAKKAADMFPNLGGTDAEKGVLVKALDSLEEDARESLTKALKAADAAVSKKFEEVGKSARDEGSASYKLEKLAKGYADENKVTFETAFAEVTKSGEGAELLKQERTERASN